MNFILQRQKVNQWRLIERRFYRSWVRGLEAASQLFIRGEVALLTVSERF
jgi:hypothetical protein